MPTIFDIKRFALHDGPGIRTTVFFKGCPLRCAWCHNPESQHTEPEEYVENRLIDGKEYSRTRVYGKKVGQDALLEEILRDRVFFGESGGGITFSGGEPLMQYRALVDLLAALGREGIHRAVDTSGHARSEIMLNVAGQTDLFLYDLKIMDPQVHKQYTGVDNRLILENADLLLEHGASVIFRIPVIPGVNDTDREIEAFRKFLSDRAGRYTDVHLLPYHRTGEGKYLRMEKTYVVAALEEPGTEQMKQLKDVFESSGIPTTIGG